MNQYCLGRIVGNDLPPRHGENQTYLNLKFILDNEQEFENCTKLWIVNRIINRESEASILELLVKHGQTFVHLPFELTSYDLSWDFDQKLNYAIQLNHARNILITEGNKFAKWTVLADGGHFFPSSGWENIRKESDNNSDGLFKISVFRLMKSNTEVYEFNASKYHVENEPIIALRSNSDIRFDEAVAYGRNEKKILLQEYPEASIIDYSLRLCDFSKFGFIKELRSVQRYTAMENLVNLVDQMHAEKQSKND